jgi:hypothetical protein
MERGKRRLNSFSYSPSPFFLQAVRNNVNIERSLGLPGFLSEMVSSLAQQSNLVCPNCLRNGTTTSANRTPLLVKGQYCVVCGYRQAKAPSLPEIRSGASKKSWETRRTNEREGDLFG